MIRPGLLIPLPGLLVILACATAREEIATELPFHVALVVDLEAAELRELSGTQSDPDLEIQLDRRALETALERALERRFVRVTTLPAPAPTPPGEPAPTPAAGGTTSFAETVTRSLPEALAAGADILAVATLDYDPRVDGETNDRFWLNLPLFLLGGPFCYWVNDRSYEVKASLTVRLYDVGVLGDPGRIDERRASIGAFEVDYGGADLDFVDRAGGNVGSYAVSLICPAGFLARSTPSVAESLEEDTVASLSEDAARKIQANQLWLLEPAGFNFHVQPSDLRATATADGLVELAGVVRFVPDARVERLEGLVIDTGAESRQIEFGEPRLLPPRAGATEYGYDVRERLPLPGNAETVRVTVHALGGTRRRTYTLQVEEPAASAAAVQEDQR